jgi:hypothetical protein
MHEISIFLTHVVIDDKEQSFPSVAASNLIFFICMILGIVLLVALVLIRNRVVKLSLPSSSIAGSK